MAKSDSTAPALSRSSRPRVPALGPRGEGWVAAQLILMTAIMLSRGRAPRRGVRLAGTALTAAGLCVAAAAGRALGRALTMFPRPRREGELVTRGPYALVRHPMYAAGILVLGGQAVYRGSSRGVYLTMALALLWDLKARREEIWLAQRFPAYAAYAATRRRLVPGVY